MGSTNGPFVEATGNLKTKIVCFIIIDCKRFQRELLPRMEKLEDLRDNLIIYFNSKRNDWRERLRRFSESDSSVIRMDVLAIIVLNMKKGTSSHGEVKPN